MKGKRKSRSRINSELLKLVRKEIRREPLRLYMGDWIRTWDSLAPCKTACCIAGLAVVLHDLMDQNEAFDDKKTFRKSSEAWKDLHISDRASEILGLKFGEADRLFYTDRWPMRYRCQYKKAKTIKGRRAARIAMAAVASRRINHFIKTKGRE